MYQKDYEKVRRVLEKSDAIVAELAKKFGEREALSKASDVCERLWAEEFPKEEGYGRMRRLDLSSADLSGGRFVGIKGELFYSANLQSAKLDRTRWLFSDLNFADLTRASLRESFLMVWCTGTVFREADLSGAKIKFFPTSGGDPVDFTNANLSGATIELRGPIPLIFTGAQMHGCQVSPSGESTSPRDMARYKEGVDLFFSCLSEEQRAQVQVLWASTKEPETSMKKPETPMGDNSGGCFIATAVCGTDQADDVVRLRAYRDTVLRQTGIGRTFITAYEATSPPVARLIARSPLARSLVRSLVVRPARRLVDSLLSRPSLGAESRIAKR